jgi:hypothetical protein
MGGCQKKLHIRQEGLPPLYHLVAVWHPDFFEDNMSQLCRLSESGILWDPLYTQYTITLKIDYPLFYFT